MKTILLGFFAIGVASAQILSFSHIVVIVQENRTPDNLFQGLCAPPYGTANSCSTQPGAGQYDIQATKWLDKTSSTGFTNPGLVALANSFDLSHSHTAFVSMCDVNPATGACRNDGAANIRCALGTCPAKAQFNYIDNSSGIVNPYLDMAKQYGWANYMFQTNQGPSFPA
ncbi:MAG: hypothetical protein WAN65_13665, partial [Candidatus Sulfotelmatobacter sp.]